MAIKLLSGNEAIALGAYESGVKYASGYPGTPSTEILENLVKYKNVYAQWSPNEKVALENAIGANFSGVRTLVTMKHVGVNVAADPLMTLSYTGINAGMVIVTADDPELHSSQNEQDNRNYARFAKIPVIEPADSEECRVLLKKAFEISEEFDTPVLFRITTRIAHTRTIVTIDKKNKVTIKNKKFIKNPAKYVMIPAYGRKKHFVIEERKNNLIKFNSNFKENIIVNSRKNKDIGIITSGVVYNYVKEVIPDISILKLTMTYPLPENLIRKFCKNKKKIYIIEELDDFLESEILKYRLPIEIIGKDIIPFTGELTPDRLYEYFYKKQIKPEFKINTLLPPRLPVLCAGCPHRAVYVKLKEKKITVMGDIGCYTLGTLPPLNSLDTCVCMGAGIGMASGFIKANPKYANKMVAVIGDSTFVHSGITGVIEALYNNSNITTMILDNRITAMTGHQEHPGTGKTLEGKETSELNYVSLLKGIGYSDDTIDNINPLNTKKLDEILNKHLNLNKPSVIICSYPCALIIKKRKPVYFEIQQDKCKKCNACLNTSCPAIQKRNNKIFIDKNLCDACSVCVQVCKFNAIKSKKR